MFSGLLVKLKLGKSWAYNTINLIFIYKYPHVPYLPSYKMIPTLQLSIFRNTECACLCLCLLSVPPSDDDLGKKFSSIVGTCVKLTFHSQIS